MHITKKKEWRVQKVSGFEASWVTFTVKWAKSQKVQLSLLETTFCSQFCLLTWMGVTLPAISPECSFENVNLFNSVFLRTDNVLDTVICFSLNCGLWSPEGIQTILVWIATNLKFLHGENLIPHTTPTVAHTLVGMIKTCEILCIKADRMYIFKKTSWPSEIRVRKDVETLWQPELGSWCTCSLNI